MVILTVVDSFFLVCPFVTLPKFTFTLQTADILVHGLARHQSGVALVECSRVMAHAVEMQRSTTMEAICLGVSAMGASQHRCVCGNGGFALTTVNIFCDIKVIALR